MLKRAILPADNVELSGIVIGEIAAGFIGGVTSQAAAVLLNDKKRDSNFLEGLSTGTYFGVRSLVRVLSGIVGLPDALANVIAGVAASLFSESAKVEARRRELAASLQLGTVSEFNLSLHSMGTAIIDRRLTVDREIQILRGVPMTDVMRTGISIVLLVLLLFIFFYRKNCIC